MKQKKNISMKVMVLLLVVGLLIGGTVGGTLAWLIDKPNAVTNTFTAGDVDIALNESELSLKMVPGAKIKKDPNITVTVDSEPCYIFVKIEEIYTAPEGETPDYAVDQFLKYTVDNTIWTKLAGYDGVYYHTVDNPSEITQPLYVLKGDNSVEAYKNGYVTVNTTVTKEMLDKVTETKAPTLKFTAYAIQKSGFENNVSGAWTEVSNN